VWRLLDNVTPGTRAAVEKRLREIERERATLQDRAESLERISLSRAEVREMVREPEEFLAGLERALASGPLENRHSAMRRCLQGIEYHHELTAANLRVAIVPIAPGMVNALGFAEVRVSI
jgi:hypothetical protein